MLGKLLPPVPHGQFFLSELSHRRRLELPGSQKLERTPSKTLETTSGLIVVEEFQERQTEGAQTDALA